MLLNGDENLTFEKKISQTKPNQNNNPELSSEKYIWMFSNQQVELKKSKYATRTSGNIFEYISVKAFNPWEMFVFGRQKINITLFNTA